MVRVQLQVINAMVEHAVREEPLESCGLLTRRDEVIDGIQPCSNERRSPVRFDISPRELLDFFRRLREEDTHFAGIYHSHPQTSPVPSQTDIDNFHYPGVSYWIISLASDEPTAACFEWSGGDFVRAGYAISGMEQAS